MLRRLLFIAAALFAPSLALADPGAPEIDEAGGLPAGYHLVWADEFNHGAGPDRHVWSYDTTWNAHGWFNNELEYYSGNRRENARIENGALVLEARHEDMTHASDWGGQHFTSARIVTRGHKSWTYGFFEIRAKFTCAYGSWPAIWMLGEGGGWPAQGEIDIMEHVGRQPGVVHGTVHTTSYNHRDHTQRTATKAAPEVCTDNAFHLYQLTWTPDRITIGYDNRNYYQFSRDAAGGHDAWPFDAPEYLILNLAVGGWGGDTDQIKASDFPQHMAIDYVRVYQAN
ncbi:MAG: glycoside hydrolase family 16 protein [Pseudomonadota bacterium]